MWPYLESGMCSMKDLVIQGGTLFMTLLRVIMFVLVVLVKMGTGIMPAFLSLVSSVYEFHRTQLTVIDLVFEFIFVSLMLIMLVYSKEILDYIWQIEVKLERSSKEATRKAMRIAPHISFFTLSFIFSLLGRKIFKPLSHERVLPLFSLVLPVLRTVYGSLLMPTNPQGQLSSGALTPTVSSSATIGRKKMDESALREMDADDLERIAASGRRTILLWIVLAMYHAIATVLTHMPFMGRLRFFFPFLRELVLVVLLWAQMNPLFIEIVYEATSPILVKAASFIPSSSAEEERGLAILSFLKSMKVINEGTEAFFRALCVESTSFLLIILFVFVPSPSHIFAHVGLVILSLILPSIRAAAVVAQWETPSVREHEGDRGRSRKRGSRDSGGGGIAQAGGRSTSMPSMAERGRDMLDHISRTLSLGGLMGHSGGKLGESGDDGDYTSGATPTSRSPAQRDCTFTVGVLTTGRKIRKGSDTTSSIILRQKRWLEYFTCIAIVWLLRCHGIFLWPSVGMLLAWYLSHSLWAGARPLSRYLVKLARLGMVMLTPIILFRMTRQLIGLAVTVSTPRRDQEPLSSRGTRPRQHEDGDPRLVRLQGEGEEDEDSTGTPFVQGANGQPSNSGAGNGLLQRSGSRRKKGKGSGHEMSPFDMDENDDDDGEVPTPGSLSMSTPGLYEHRIADISGAGIRSGPSPESFRIPDCADSSLRAGRTAEVEVGAEEGDTRASDGAGPVGARFVGRARRRSNSKTRK